ncbi:Collagenase [Minicystis rosea]|nr:Collagenase [Minicystis rosea]
MFSALLLAAALAFASPDAVPLASAPPPASALVGDGFVLIAEEKGVKVYRREKRAGFEFAAEGTLAAPAAQVRRALLDYPSHQKWQKYMKECRVLTRSDDALDVYQRMSPPVVDDRDYTLHVTWGDDGGVLWTRAAVANERGPAPVSGVIRISTNETSWRLEPIDGGRSTRAVYRIHIDMAGSVPTWMAKGQASSDIPDFFANLGKQLPSYR